MKKKSYIHNPGALKIDLMLRGIKIEDPVVKAWACGSSGIDVVLPERTPVNIPCSEQFTSASPYVIRKGGGSYVITDGSGEEVAVELTPRPRFYDMETSTGVKFSRIATVHGSYTAITPLTKCDFFNSDIECRYCAGNFTENGSVYSVDEVIETVEAVLSEKKSEVIYLSIGFSEGPDGGIEFLKPYVKAIKKHFNCLVAVEALPPRENHWIEETYAVGADSILYNLEIFDEELFSIICPGRAKRIGRKRYLDALEYGAKVFPNGTVASHLIVGLEPPGSTCMGINYLTDIGVVPVLPIYRPRPGRALRIEPLDAEIIIPVYRHLYKALKKKKVNFKWVSDLSTVTTPVEGRFLVDGEKGKVTLFDNFYKSRLGRKTALGLSTIRRKLRVKEVGGEDDPDKKA